MIPELTTNDLPTTGEFLPFSRPWIGEEEIAAVAECLRSGWITTGPRVKAFEAEFAELVGSRHAVALNSCAAGLHLALEALEIQPGDEVLVPTMTHAATAEVVCHLGARPVLLDCDPVTLNLSTDRLAEYLQDRCVRHADGLRSRESGARVRAVVPVHFAGLSCEMDRIMALAAEYDLRVVEDAAHCLPSHFRGRVTGTFGDAGAFSFYATKSITTGEGGMLVTDVDTIADRARLMCMHGISRDAWLRYTAEGSWYYEILAAGFKYNMSDIAAALGREQLRRCDELWEIRRAYAARYTHAFLECPEIIPPAEAPAGSQHAWHLYAIRLKTELLTLDRTDFIEECKRRGIGTSVHFIPLHLHPFYRETHGYRPEHLPAATRAYEGLVSLPLYPRMHESDVDRVIETVLDILDQNRR